MDYLKNLQRPNRISMVNQRLSTKCLCRLISELRSTFPIIPKDLAKWIHSTYWKKLIFYEIQFWSFCETISSITYRFLKNHQNFHQNCLTKRPKLIFRKNQNFPMCKIHSFCQIFWNYGKSRSELLARWYRKFWSIWLIYYWNPIVALQVFETFYDKLGYRTKFWFGSCIGSHNFQKTFLGSNVIVFGQN